MKAFCIMTMFRSVLRKKILNCRKISLSIDGENERRSRQRNLMSSDRGVICINE